jgi:hypothetical protein
MPQVSHLAQLSGGTLYETDDKDPYGIAWVAVTSRSLQVNGRPGEHGTGIVKKDKFGRQIYPRPPEFGTALIPIEEIQAVLFTGYDGGPASITAVAAGMKFEFFFEADHMLKSWALAETIWRARMGAPRK